MKVLVVAAHPDDEVLGCGGTLALHAEQGHDVRVLFISDGETSREGVSAATSISSRQQDAEDAAAIMGVSKVLFENFPDNQLDTVSLLKITQAIEKVLRDYQPDIIYTHFENDLNIDHHLTYRAVLTACRPPAFPSVKLIASFEVLSSTEWRPGQTVTSFTPSLFVDISRTLDRKINAMRCYEKEMREFPHPRSAEAIAHLAGFRGAISYMPASEAFLIVRQFGLPGSTN